MKNFLHFIDPYRQGPWFFYWGFWSAMFVVGLSWFLLAQWGDFLVQGLLDNIFVYFPNYLVHEMVGHNFIGQIGWRVCHNACPAVGEWWMAVMGNGMETLIPLLLLLIALRLSGGRWLLPGLWYWLGSTLYGAGIYASDARACKLPLTSSDMMTNYAPGTVKGDWYYILEPIGLLNYDVIIGRTLIVLGIFCAVIAIYSLYYYLTHTDQYWEGTLNNR